MFKKAIYELNNIYLGKFLKSQILENKLKYIIRVIFNFFYRRKLIALRTSTGMWGLAYALKNIRNISSIYLIGIGFNPDSGHFYDNRFKYGNGHIESDKYFIKDVLRKWRKVNIEVTDPESKKILWL